jgi:hypothetical protein
MNVRDARATRLSQGRVELVMGELGFGEHALEEPAVMDENFGTPLDDRRQPLTAIRAKTDEPVNTDERGRRDEPAHQGVVAGVHRVLDRVGQHEEQDQIEGRELTHLSLAGETKKDDQKEINDDTADEEFPPRDRHLQHQESVLLSRPTYASTVSDRLPAPGEQGP